MADLSLELCGVKLKNPIIAASGTFGFGREYDELYDIGQLGGISVKGLSLKPRTATRLPALQKRRAACSTASDFKTPAWIALWKTICRGCLKRTSR